jgi:heme exporter protein B
VARPSWIAQAARIAWKDLHIEGRSREVVYTMGFMAALVVLVFSFAFISGREVTVGPDVIAGILWVAVLFSGTVALVAHLRSRTGKRGHPLAAALACPALGHLRGQAGGHRGHHVPGGIAAHAPAGGSVFRGHRPHALWLGLLLLLGTIGFCAVGVIFSAALLRARSRDALLGALLFPIVIPVLLAASRATATLLDPAIPDLDPAFFWTRFLAALDVVFVVVGLWSFEPVVIGE